MPSETKTGKMHNELYEKNPEQITPSATNINMNSYIHEVWEHEVSNTGTRLSLYKCFKQCKWLTLSVFLINLTGPGPRLKTVLGQDIVSRLNITELNWKLHEFRHDFCTVIFLVLYASGCVLQCQTGNRQVAGSNLSLGYFVQWSTQPSIPPGSVN